MPEAMKSETTDRDTLRKMCAIRGLEYHPAHKAPALQRMLDQYELRNAPPATPADKVVINNPGFSCDKPQTPDWEMPSVSDIEKMRQKMDDALVGEEDRMLAETMPADEQPEMLAKPPSRPPPPEVFTQPKREIPANVTEALEWLGHYSIGRTNLICKYIDTLLRVDPI